MHASMVGLVQRQLIDFMSAFVGLLSTMSAHCQNISVKTAHSLKSGSRSDLEEKIPLQLSAGSWESCVEEEIMPFWKG